SSYEIVSRAALASGYDEHSHVPYLSASPDGDVWEPQIALGGGLEIIGLDDNRFFVRSGVGPAFYTDDFGVTQIPAPIDGYGGAHQGDYRNGLFVIGGSFAGIWFSHDREIGRASCRGRGE